MILDAYGRPVEVEPIPESPGPDYFAPDDWFEEFVAAQMPPVGKDWVELVW